MNVYEALKIIIWKALKNSFFYFYLKMFLFHVVFISILKLHIYSNEENEHEQTLD